MGKNYIIKKILSIAFLLIVLCTNNVFAQIHNNGSLYISDNAEMYIASGNISFGSSSDITTSRTASTNGKLSIGENVAFDSASLTSNVDGYIKMYGTTDKLLPTAQLTTYAPVKVAPGTGSSFEVAYYEASPVSAFGSDVQSPILQVSATQYWDISSSSGDAVISVGWNSSNNAELVSTFVLSSDLSELTIVGWNGSQWIEIPSQVDTTNLFSGTGTTLVSGSISTNEAVDTSTYRYFTLGVRDDCAPIITSSGNTKTWDGSAWSPSEPTLEDPVVINGPFSGTLQCNSIVLNNDLTLVDDDYLEIVRGASGTGTVYMSSNAALVQRDASADAPTVEITKTTRTIRKVNDYVYWGTPIEGDFKTQMSTASAQGYDTDGAFDAYYNWVAGSSPSNSGFGWQVMSSTETGIGFLSRVKDQIPFVTDGSFSGKIDVTLTGVANNGDVTVSVAQNGACTTCGSSYNLLANPYPSAINAALFLRTNTNLDGAIYIWSKSETGENTQADYAVWNLAGSVNTSPVTYSIDGKIPSAQGFMVRALNNGDVTFTNCMRLVEDNNNFFRMSNDLPDVADKYKLNLYNNEDVFSQILIAYTPEATMEYDRLFDAGRNSVSSTQFYSVFEGDGRKLAINSRPEFEITDQVQLGISKTNADQANYTIALDERNGIFAGEEVIVYLYDQQEEVYHNLNLSPYNFTVFGNLTNDRFKIVYENQALQNDDFINHKNTAVITNGTLKVTASTTIQDIEVYDLTGRLIATYYNVGKTELSEAFNHQEAVYIAKIKLSNGMVTSVKLVNTKQQQ
ncbi:hypothetical protein GCM10007424_16100 [Flavobacterium suaedae]|uniref:T9SS type A sorting domain-containing protein n=1 Tax=Flavobacterium suaedae TaxID=1767027 RepID=A0ABQ1JXR1_9FLAO|nr:hypothetical protein [Flavobacterium suaedae]GGB76845.1 hypothetical protein GCM10007424_16100 [Flavobacterium suaedae]